MKRCLRLLLCAGFLVWLATGFYVVGGNESAVVRRCGKVLRTPGGQVALRSGGLHYDLPWPFSRVNRVNLNEVKTLTVGLSELEDLSDEQLLRAASAVTPSRYLTGDKNILNIKIGIQYRIAEEQVDAYLFGTQSAEDRLRVLAEGVLSDLLSRSGVDFVHTQGRALLQEMMTDRVREEALKYRLGLRVDTVTFESVEPPLRVRAAFLDVNNARADREKYIHAARAYAAERQQAAWADARQILDEAEIYRRQVVQQARAEADSFRRLMAEFRSSDRLSGRALETARSLALRRLYLETMEEIFRRVKVKVILQSGKPVDLSIFRDANP